ncbi:hypothetical protein pipiens_019974 [Culex pipiens pipiens]|uniref:Uncharacterized protein n=1 Tax=Culex pipiens pipiens TaxID=38569 RepID=A0ABD1DPV4_CULPP
MSQILFEVTRNAAAIKLEETIDGTTIGDLIKSLKAAKESSNATLTQLLEEEKNAPQKETVPKDAEGDEEDDDD